MSLDNPGILFLFALVLLSIIWMLKPMATQKESNNESANNDPPHGPHASLHDILDHIVMDRRFFNLYQPRRKYNAIIQELLTKKRRFWMIPCNNFILFHGMTIPIYYAYHETSDTAYELRYLPSKVDWEIFQVLPKDPPPVPC
jgi:hypothetical protein